MFDYLRDLRKSEEEKRQEALSAYLDDALTPAEKERFERLLASDETLRTSLEEQRLIRASMARLPRMRAPRSFTLDPALYGRPVESTAERLYPIMRVATAAVALLFVLVLVLEFTAVGDGSLATDQEPITMAEPVQEAIEEPAAAEAQLEEVVVEREMVDETVVEVTQEVEEAFEMAAEAPAEEVAAPAEEAVEEEAEMPSPEDAMGGGAPVADAPESEEAPLAQEPPPAGEGVASETVAEENAARAADELPRPSVAVSATAAAKETAEMTLTEEALTSLPTPGATASFYAAPADDGEAARDFAAADTDADTGEARPWTNQILVITLGLALIVLAVVTLLLRRQVN